MVPLSLVLTLGEMIPTTQPTDSSPPSKLDSFPGAINLCSITLSILIPLSQKPSLETLYNSHTEYPVKTLNQQSKKRNPERNEAI